MMKKLLALTMVAVMGLFAGCASTGKLIASSSATVDAALKAYAVYYVDVGVSEDNHRKVELYQKRYYAAEDAVILAYSDYRDSGNRSTLQKAKSQMLIAQQTLVNFLRELKVKGV